jgi:hypothetical protein
MAALLEAFDPNTIATPALGNYCGSVVIQFQFAAEAPHPLLIPELRRFLRVLARRWGPHSAPFFCDLKTPFLLMYYAAQLDHLLVAEYAEGDHFIVQHRSAELEALHSTALYGVQQLGRRAGLTTGQIRARQLRISRHVASAFIYPVHG